MRDFIYDLRRTLTGKFTIVMIVLIVLATVGIAYAAVSFSSGSSVAPGSEAYVYPAVFKTQYGYNVTDFVANGYGQPVAGLSIDSSLVNTTFNRTTATYSTKMDNLSGTTNSYGYFNTTVHFSLVNYTQYEYFPLYISGINVTAEFQNPIIEKNASSEGGINYYNSAVWQSTSNQSVYFVAKVANPSSKTLSNIEIYYASANGSAMPEANLYYYVQNQSSISLPLPSKEMTLYGQIGGFHNKVFTLPLNATANGFNVIVELFPPSGGVQPLVMLSSAILYSSTSSGALLEAILQVPYEFLIPILGIFSAYFYYGKDKASGVLESIITRPVTKGRIFASRFIGGAVSFLVALVVAEALSDIIIYKYTGSLLSSSYFFSILGGYLVEAIAFSGLIYLVSQFLKSQGGILGAGIGLFFVMVLFWSDLMALVLFALHVDSAVKSGVVAALALDTISPGTFPSLVIDLRSGVYGSTLGIGQGYLASSVGITTVSVVLVGLAWLLIPALASFFLARSRD